MHPDPRLDLKVVVHYGQVAQQKMTGRAELVGRDVIVAHRLLKNSVQEFHGFGAYALYTATWLVEAGIPRGGSMAKYLVLICGNERVWAEAPAAWHEANAVRHSKPAD